MYMHCQIHRQALTVSLVCNVTGSYVEGYIFFFHGLKQSSQMSITGLFFEQVQFNSVYTLRPTHALYMKCIEHMLLITDRF